MPLKRTASRFGERSDSPALLRRRKRGAGPTPAPRRLDRDLLGERFEQCGGAHAATDAHGHHTIFRLAPPPLDQDMTRQARAGHTIGVADRDRAAVHVHLRGGDPELAQRRNHLRGEGLVELDPVDLVGADRVLFGSDYPLLLYPREQQAPEFKRLLNDLVTAGLTVEEQEKVLGKNLLRLVGREY